MREDCGGDCALGGAGYCALLVVQAQQQQQPVPARGAGTRVLGGARVVAEPGG